MRNLVCCRNNDTGDWKHKIKLLNWKIKELKVNQSRRLTMELFSSRLSRTISS